MSLEVQKWLYDILVSIQSIDDFIGDVRVFEAYESDKKTRRSVEREIMIIGEAINRIRGVDSNIEIAHINQIIATRNRVAHAYDAVNNAMIWGIVINHLPSLKSEVEKLLAEHNTKI
ncbi:MAG: DUF86 domain-containing protein [Bacteroidales bacterium]|nr:DUF86 domain-containing protein [Bacteroidales bacterium]